MAQTNTVRKPIQRSLLRGGAALLIVLLVAISSLVAYIFSSTLHERFETKLENLITYVENNIDADNLAQCIQTGKTSATFDELQPFLNDVLDDFEIEYLYVVIPSHETMTNVISGTSAEEYAAGEQDLGLMENVDAYSSDQLDKYLACWEADGTSFFEETSGYGTYYTGVKPLRDSTGNTIALICADLPVNALRSGMIRMFAGSMAIFAVLLGIFGLVATRWIRGNITEPITELDQAARDFASKSHESQNMRELEFVPPAINTNNEIETLSMSITKMASDIRVHVSEALDAQEHASEMEQENVRIAEEARSAQKIAELSESVMALFTNMPGLSFSKDASTGVYLACNQAFAEYAHKPNPDGVVGLTDHQIFDPVTAQHFVDDDAKTLSMDEPYVFFEDVFDAAGNPKQFQTTKMKFYDTKGRLCTLGMCVDVTELMTARRETLVAKRAYEVIRDESITYFAIARALSGDYQSLYYVDLNTDRYSLYEADGVHDYLSVVEEGEDFFDSAHIEAGRQVYQADQQKLIDALTKDNVLRTLDEMGHFTLSYRLIVNGEPTYMGLKATLAEKGDNHLVIGISNIDAQMRQQEAARRVEEEQATIARITALSGDYLVIYAVDPDTNHYDTYRLAHEYSDSVTLTEGDDFFRDANDFVDRTVHPDDVGLIHSLLIKERVVSDIRTQGIFTMTFRQLLGGVYTYLNLRAALVEEADGPQLIMGLSNVDRQVKRDKEFALAQTRANRDALTGVKNKHAYVDAEISLDQSIDEGKETEFAIVVCDLNNLKIANDTKGHQEGDKLLKQASAIICNVFKRSPVFRIGGDEFAVILQGHDYQHSVELLRMLDDNNRANMNTGEAVVAWGISTYQAGDSVADVFSRADTAMYRNKRDLKAAQ